MSVSVHVDNSVVGCDACGEPTNNEDEGHTVAILFTRPGVTPDGSCLCAACASSLRNELSRTLERLHSNEERTHEYAHAASP